METLTAIIGAGFTPYLSKSYLPSTSLLGDSITPYVMMFLTLVGVTWITSIIRSWRYCRDNKGNVKSYGFGSGLAKGLILATICIGTALIVQALPMLQMPLKVIPFIGDATETVVIVLAYMLFYFALVYPIYGSC